MFSDEPKKKEYLYEQIADQLESDILNGEFKNDKLPSEQVLSERYNASRAIIREALKILSERHLVHSVVGSGAYITKPDVDDLSRVLRRLINTHNISIEDSIDVRIDLETSAIALAAKNATEEDLDNLEALRLRLRESMDPQERIELDFQFHALICKASHNELLALLAEAMGHVIRSLIQSNVTAGTDKPEIRRHISHGRIVRALKRRDAEAAKCILYDHLYTSKLLYDALSADDE